MDGKQCLVSFSPLEFLLFRLQICLLGVIISTSPVSSNNHTCVKQDLCSCKGSDGTINLHSLASALPGKPTFHILKDEFLYYYNPCLNFTLTNTKSKCNNVSACKYSMNSNMYEDIGKQDSVKFDYNVTRKQLFMKYSSGNTTTSVYLQCGTKIKFMMSDSSSVVTDSYIFELTTLCACPNGCPVNVVSPTNMSAGTVLCIIFIICVSTYFVVGILYKKAVESASGMDLLPHTTFWTSLPGLIKDGYLFFISPCLGDRVEYKSYERL